MAADADFENALCLMRETFQKLVCNIIPCLLLESLPFAMKAHLTRVWLDVDKGCRTGIVES